MENKALLKLTERFDRELLNILSEDLKAHRPNETRILSEIQFGQDQLPLAS